MNRLLTSIAVLCLVALSGCASMKANDPLNRAATQLIASVAVRETVTRSNASPEVIVARAGRVLAIASALKSLGNDEIATIPAVTAALNSLLDKAGLDPHERIQADFLAQALLSAVNARYDVGDKLASINLVLDAVILSAQAYLPPTPAPTT
jgi:hypothetical protein